MTFDVITIAMIVFCSMILAFVFAGAIFYYREGKRDEEFFERIRKNKNQKAKLQTGQRLR